MNKLEMKRIYEELKKHDSKWILSFMELVKLYKEAKPEHRQMVINILKRRKG